MLTDLLIDAVRDDNSAKIIELLQKGADPNGTLDSDGLTPLCFAITRKKVNAIKILVAAGADIHAYIPGHECTVLEYLQQSKAADMIALLLQSEEQSNKT